MTKKHEAPEVSGVESMSSLLQITQGKNHRKENKRGSKLENTLARVNKSEAQNRRDRVEKAGEVIHK